MTDDDDDEDGDDKPAISGTMLPMFLSMVMLSYQLSYDCRDEQKPNPKPQALNPKPKTRNPNPKP